MPFDHPYYYWIGELNVTLTRVPSIHGNQHSIEVISALMVQDETAVQQECQCIPDGDGDQTHGPCYHQLAAQHATTKLIPSPPLGFLFVVTY